jgi:hypothetical protein
MVEWARAVPLRALAPAALLALVVPGRLVAQSEAPMTDSVRFPAVTGRSLNGRTVALPGDFAGARNVVLIAFTRRQQADVDSWLPYLRTLAGRYADLRIYELPTLGRGLRLMRPFIDGGMRNGIPDSSVRAATITLYIDKSPFRAALGISDENRIHVVLVDRAGGVQWRAEGPYEPQAGAELERRLGLEAAGDADR